jgi:hypothetical protein
MLTDIRALADHFLIALPNINNVERWPCDQKEVKHEVEIMVIDKE